MFKYLNEVLKSFVVLLQLLEKADSFVVTAAELPVDLLHLLPVVIRELQDSNNVRQYLKDSFHLYFNSGFYDNFVFF